MQFSKQYIFEEVTSLFGLDLLPPMSHIIIFFGNPRSPRWATYFLNDPNAEASSGISEIVINCNYYIKYIKCALF